MKQIILQDSDTRINTLRHVFGIDKYKRILENVSILTQKLREEKRFKEALVSTLEENQLEVSSKENNLEEMKGSIMIVEKELYEKKISKKKTESEKQGIQSKIDEKIKLSSESEKTKIVILTKQDLIKSNEKLIQNLDREIKEFGKMDFKESMLKDLEVQIQFRKSEKEKINKEVLEIAGQISALTNKNQENEKLMQKMSNLEMCPTCLQDVDSVYRSNIMNKLHNEISQNKNKLQELERRLSELRNQKSDLDNEISERERKLTDLKLLRVKLESIAEKVKRKQDLFSANTSLSQDVILLRQHLEALSKTILELSKFDKIFETKSQELEQAFRQEKMIEIKLAELKKEIEVFSRHIQDLNKKIKKAKEIKMGLNYITELENWLSKKFVPLISFVETNVMVKLKLDFSEVFQEWFLMLVSENFNISLREDFTPVIEQQDYELDYSYLSGGERTAIALAYRLALNQIINSVMSKIKTKQIVILDEPTDGFSEQQLDKMRNVLDQLNAEQLIIVSHEQKIEGFVENVIKFKKENGISAKI